MDKAKEIIVEKPVHLCILFSVISLVFIVVGHRYRDEVQMALKKEFLHLPATTVDWWSMSHVIMYMLYGFFLPNYHFAFLIIGTGFEIFEDMLASDKTTQLTDCTKNKSSLLCRFSVNDDYWYAKWDDIFFNMLGYTLGSALRTNFCKF